MIDLMAVLRYTVSIGPGEVGLGVSWQGVTWLGAARQGQQA